MEKKRILCYGDSNTWGYTPVTGERYPYEVRWTGVCQKELGDDYVILEDGLNGRTTVYDVGWCEYLNGREGLGYALLTQRPLDMVVLFLGTNDLHFLPASGAQRGIEELVRRTVHADTCYYASTRVFNGAPKVLLVSPPLIDPVLIEQDSDALLAGGVEQSKKLSKYYRQVAEDFHIGFLDAAELVSPSLKDGVHLEEDQHEILGKSIAKKIRSMLSL